MSVIIKNYFLKFKSHLTDQVLITDLITKLIITFGVVLIVGGLYLMITNPDGSTQVAQAIQARQSAVSVVNWVPGIPFYMGDLTTLGTATVGLVSWIIGVDLVLVGLGLWVRHRLARLAAVSVFGLAACFQFIQFLYFGVLGSPASILEFSINGVIVYFLFSRFDINKPFCR